MIRQEEQWLLNEKYKGEKTPDFLADFKQLKAGIPLAYLIGHVPFLGCQIYLDSKPLIPRPETEYWVEKAIKEVKGGNRVLDLCAGSGCIGVAVAKSLPTVQVDFAELDESHHPTIRKNLEANGLEISKSKIFGGDLFEKISEKYDFILSNPPYIDPALDRTEDGVKNHEPHLALYGGKSGIEIIRQIISDAPNHLNPDGQLWLEHEPEQAAAVAFLAIQAGFSRASSYPDQYGVLRYSVLVC